MAPIVERTSKSARRILQEVAFDAEGLRHHLVEKGAKNPTVVTADVIPAELT